MTHDPAGVLIAGLGNIFLGDDAFGVEVARRLSTMTLPAGVQVIDVGVRARDLAYVMLQRRYDAVILIDAIEKGADPGTLHLLEPDPEAVRGPAIGDGHSIQPHEVIALVRQLGGRLPAMFIVGCEPSRIGPDAGLSAPVAAAVEDAVRLVLQLASSPALMPVRM